jgi:hypothetical protein
MCSLVTYPVVQGFVSVTLSHKYSLHDNAPVTNEQIPDIPEYLGQHHHKRELQ